MNYYQARKRESDGRYDFTARNDDRIWPVGYCGAFREWWNSDSMKGYPINPKEIEQAKAFSHKHHADGHETAEEAAECYKVYLLDHQLRLGVENKTEQHRCEVCEAWTSLEAQVGWSFSAWLCAEHCNREEMEKLYPEHCNREEMEKLYPTPHQIISS